MSPQWEKLAASDQTILITGRTGTGKSHLAREIHERSGRRERKFVAINLATLSENLIESELFGHERGAFSGADSRRTGRLEAANGGTAFLDEIGELSPRMQTKLLEALNSRTISPVGSNREIALDIRIVVATNRDLPQMVRLGTFREDLYFRINTFQVELSPLSATPDRISPLASGFARASAARQGRSYEGLSAALVEELRRYPWPGNVRELKNCMEFAVAMTEGGPLQRELLPPYMREEGGPRTGLAMPEQSFPVDYREARSCFERSYLLNVLRRFGGKINHTARECGLSKVTLIEKIRRYEIDVKRIRYGAFVEEAK